MPATYESGFSTTLATKLGAADVTMTVATAPTVTKGRLYLKSGTQEERIKFTGVSSTTLTGLVRGLSKTANPATAGTGKDWIAGTKVKLVAMHDQLPDEDMANIFDGDNTFNGTNTYTKPIILSGATAPLELAQMTTTQRLALTPVNGMMVYDSTLGLIYQYKGGAWGTVDTGTATANGSTTVNGTYQEATVAQQGTATATGSTGARLTLACENLVKTSSGAGDENKIAILNASGQFASGFVNTAGVEALTTVSLTAGENVTIGDNLCFGNTSASEQMISTDVNDTEGFGQVPTNTANLAQKITLSSVGYYQRINTVKYNIKKSGSPTDNVTVSIYNDDLVTVVDTSSAVSGSTMTTSSVQYTFTFSGNQNLIPGKTYYLVLRRSGAENNTDCYIADVQRSGGSSELFRFEGTDWSVINAVYKLKYEINITTYTVDPTTVMKMDANDPLKIQDAGIATETKTTGQAVKVQMSGVVAGLSGLTPNLYYYASDTAGALSTTPSTTYNIRIGKAISATQLLIDKKKQNIYTRTFAVADMKYNGAAVDYNAAYSNKYIRVYTGFRPTKVTTMCGGTTAPNGGIVCNGMSDGTTNYCTYLVDNGPTTDIGLNTSYSVKTTYSATVTDTILGTINILDNGFELYYSKAATSLFDSTTSMRFLSE